MRRNLPTPPMFADWPESTRPLRHRFTRKLREAFRGAKKGVRGESNFFVLFFFAAIALTAAIALDCSLVEWCLLILSIGGVVAAELFNSAIEALFSGLDEAARARWYGCLDISAGAVLIVGITALLVGVLIFGHRLWILLAS